MHHGIYVGGGRVIHYSGFSSRLRAGPVEVVSREEFAQGWRISVRTDAAHYDGEQIIVRAHARLGEQRYRLLTNNCRHFCDWCRRGPLPLTLSVLGRS
jgi:Lecithin retinol acyltransferase